MRKHVLTRLKALLTAACAPLYTRLARTATPKFDIEPDADRFSTNDDAWLFESESEAEAVRAQLSHEMNRLADSFSDLRETLALIHGETPFPIEATTLAPCAIGHHDEALFDGEPEAPFIPAQEEISGGESIFLFEETIGFDEEDTLLQQQAA